MPSPATRWHNLGAASVRRADSDINEGAFKVGQFELLSL
jgi:hypothetical protein